EDDRGPALSQHPPELEMRGKLPRVSCNMRILAHYGGPVFTGGWLCQVVPRKQRDRCTTHSTLIATQPTCHPHSTCSFERAPRLELSCGATLRRAAPRHAAENTDICVVVASSSSRKYFTRARRARV